MDADGDQRPADRGNDVGIRSLPGIEEGHEEQPGESADKCGSDDLQRDHDGTPGAAVRIGQMPLTAWTGRHRRLCREPIHTIT